MLPKQFRLTNNSAFIATYNNHNIISNENVIIYLGKKKIDADFPTRFGFVVSKKVHKRAVVRNRIKRFMREAIRLAIKNNSLNNIHSYMSVIITAKNNATFSSFTSLSTSIYKLLSNKL